MYQVAGAQWALSFSFMLLAAAAQAQSQGDNWTAGSYQGPVGSAVSAPNYKLQIGGGSVAGANGDADALDVRGSYSAPLTFSTGFQIDGIVAGVDDEAWGMLGGHLFWRNPESGLVGAYAEFNGYDGVEWGKVAGEGEIYMNRITFSSVTGIEFGDVDTTFFTETTGKYYFTDDLMLKTGYRHDSAGGTGITELEYQASPTLSGLTLFADGNWNEDGFDSVLGGVKFYFGEPKSLIRRHREDDPGEVGSVASGANQAHRSGR